MKNISSLIRHGLTYLAGIGGFLFQHGLIDASGVDAANKAGEQLIDPLAIITGLMAVVAMRAAIALLGKIFPSIAEKASGGMSGGALLFVVCGTAAALMGCLPSCSDYPVTATLSYRDPNSGAKAGLTYSPAKKLRGKLKVPVYDPQTGELLGSTGIAIGKKAVVTATK